MQYAIEGSFWDPQRNHLPRFIPTVSKIGTILISYMYRPERTASKTFHGAFPPTVKAHLRKSYNWTFTICLNPLSEEGSHCAHLFQASKFGDEQVGSEIPIEYPWLIPGVKVDDAVSLGLLDPTELYDRSASSNGIIRASPVLDLLSSR